MDSSVVAPAFLRFEGGLWADPEAEPDMATRPLSGPFDDAYLVDLGGLVGGSADRLDPALHWVPSLRAVGALDDALPVYDRLRRAYNESHRKHHTTQYLVECLAHLVQWHEAAEHPHEVALAIWFKDSVFDPARHDNEGRSARLAFDSLTGAGVDTEIARRVRDLVVATRNDGPPATADGRLLVDIDQAILGADPARHAQAEHDLRHELGHVTDFIYRRRRIESLKALAARLRLYHSEVVRASLETRARANIANTIARLQSRVLNPESLFR